MTPSRLIGIAGLVAWLLVGLRAVAFHAGAPPPAGAWIAAYLLFGALFAAACRAGDRLPLALVAAQAAGGLALTLLGCNGYEGILLAAAALQLGGRLRPAAGMLWIGLQTALLAAALAFQLGSRAAWLLTPPYAALQAVAFFTFSCVAREVALRSALAAANQELLAMQAALADGSRLAERLRIAHELHDALGHRLTALTLNLEVALQCVQGAARPNVEVAQALARELLADVRAIVAGSQAAAGLPIAPALRSLASAVPRPRIHLDVPPDLLLADPERAHVFLRCAQEIVTNAARHSNAENLWIAVAQDGEALSIEAHDDGRGSAGAPHGFGLRGMRERLERAGGELRIATRPGHGFDIRAVLPAGGSGSA